MPGVGILNRSASILRPSSQGGARELFTFSNAASDPNDNEADATTGFASVGLTGTGANVFESQSVVKSDGNYAFKTDSNDTPTSGCRIFVDLQALDTPPENGFTYELKYKIRHLGTGDKWIGYLASSGAGNNHIVGANVYNFLVTFLEVITEFTYDSTYRYLLFRENSAANDGGIYLDNISLKKKVT